MASERTWTEVKSARLDLLEDEYEQLKEENISLRGEIYELENQLESGLNRQMDNARRMALEEAAVEMCPYCKGYAGFQAVPVRTGLGPGLWHCLIYGNGANRCKSTVLWEMVQVEKEKLVRHVPRSKSRAT